MKTTLTNLLSRFIRRSRAEPLPAMLAEAGIEHFGRHFPNPQRKNCPPPESFEALVQGQQLPSDELREHLFSCSECFVSYRAALSGERTVESSVAGTILNRKRRHQRLVPIFGGLVMVLGLATLFVLVKKISQTGDHQVSVNANERPSVATPADGRVLQQVLSSPSPENTPAEPPASQGGRNDSSTHMAANRVTIDLERDDALRGAEQVKQKSVSLRRARNELTVKLPAGSPAGTYQVILNDSFGTALRSVIANSRDGKQLRLDWNLASVATGKYLVCVTRETEVPQCVLAKIETPRKPKR